MENPEERSSKFNKWVYDKASFQIGGEKKGGEGGEKRYWMWEGGSGGRRIYVYIWLIQNAVQQKFIQHRGTIIVKLKKKKGGKNESDIYNVSYRLTEVIGPAMHPFVRPTLIFW